MYLFRRKGFDFERVAAWKGGRVLHHSKKAVSSSLEEMENTRFAMKRHANRSTRPSVCMNSILWKILQAWHCYITIFCIDFRMASAWNERAINLKDEKKKNLQWVKINEIQVSKECIQITVTFVKLLVATLTIVVYLYSWIKQCS